MKVSNKANILREHCQGWRTSRSHAPFTSARPRKAAALRVMAAYPAVTQWVGAHLPGGPVVRECSLGGSGWSSAFVVETQGGQRYFVKTSQGRDDGGSMFRGEALGLQALYGEERGLDTHTLRVPKVFHVGSLSEDGSSTAEDSSSRGSSSSSNSSGSKGRGGAGGSFIVMEYLDLRGGGGGVDMAALGRGLAQMHLATPTVREGVRGYLGFRERGFIYLDFRTSDDPVAAAGQFGFPTDNTLGGSPQLNGWSDDWVAFWRERRLQPQLRMTGDTKLMRLGERLCDNLHCFFEGIDVRPSVLHGDLWSGNIGCVGGQPAIFDPATYFGHHEAEFGMSWCAGFTQEFYIAYHELIPRAPGFERRAELYRLYHYLNHLNLFGEGYYSQCASILQRLTS
ncbi:hypothetical protein Agub_g9780 [Astrephomene gubernaculifera]|uniref:protein-ribulosamine 3-kinase n=1 Tax=Astrephomene gubernaculifera TaxID=47775 RepID=A0AAD3HPP0_9CHLO|nr:hypothetical protein Agub_g9780 [Astrephomene gubernaculifera]